MSADERMTEDRLDEIVEWAETILTGKTQQTVFALVAEIQKLRDSHPPNDHASDCRCRGCRDWFASVHEPMGSDPEQQSTAEPLRELPTVETCENAAFIKLLPGKSVRAVQAHHDNQPGPLVFRLLNADGETVAFKVVCLPLRDHYGHPDCQCLRCEAGSGVCLDCGRPPHVYRARQALREDEQADGGWDATTQA